VSGNKYPEIRVKYAEVTKPLGSKDFAIIKGALGERGGFDGRVITEILTQFGVEDKALEKLKNLVSSEQTAAPLNDDDALNAFLLCCLTSAALGEEELSTIRGYDRDEFYTTIRRLYHGVRNSIRTQE
jgi:hypothetical protein